MAVSTEAIKQLRAMTGAGMMDVKKALDETSGLHQMAAARVHEAVLHAEHVLHESQVRRGLRPESRQAANVDVAHDPPRYERLERR